MCTKNNLPTNFMTAIGAVYVNNVIADKMLTAYIGAVLTKGGRVISVATNVGGIKNKWAEKYRALYAHHEYIQSTHAEVAVILQARKKFDLTGSKLWVARVTYKGVISYVKPCPMCDKVIKLHGISRVYYTIDESSYGVMNTYSDEKRIVGVPFEENVMQESRHNHSL